MKAPRAFRVLAAMVLLALALTAVARASDMPTHALRRELLGHSGALLSYVVRDRVVKAFDRESLKLPEKPPGIYPFGWPASWSAFKPATGMSMIVPIPFSAKTKGKLGSYDMGSWPNEKPTSKGPAAFGYAAKKAAYALPHGFIQVTKEGASTRLSEHFKLGQFLTKNQGGVWPKYVVLDLKLVDKLELMIAALQEAGHEVKGLHVMSGFRTPSYNEQGVGAGGRSAISRHIYGDAADVYPDDDGDDRLDDLNGDGKVDLEDAHILAKAAEAVEKKYPDLIGGIGIYPATSAHGPFVHVDTRGTRARW